MTVEKAFNALKNNDFEAARALIAAQEAAAYGVAHFLIKGLAELYLKEWIEALKTFTLATERFPEYALFWLNKGIAEENIGALDAAITSQEQCIALNPAQGEAYGNLSNLYRKQRLFGEAEANARLALENGASRSDALNSLALALGKQKKFVAAETAFHLAHEAALNNPEIILNQANLAVDQLKLDEAWPLFSAARAIEDRAVFRRDEGMARLLAQDYELGWALFEARLEMPGALRLHPTAPRWQGESLANKKLLIIAEQGFGDTLQFCRYNQFLDEGELIWAVPKTLVRLLSRSLRGTVLDEASSLPVYDYYIPMMSLPYTTQKYVCPALAPYLTAELHPILPTGKHDLKVGLIWAGSQTHERDHERSIHLEEFGPLFDGLKADFYAPFLGHALQEIGKYPVAKLAHLIHDFADTAALLKQMNFIITVDTAVAHLAGALGIKTFLLLTHCSDWRWGISGENTQLYPSLTIIRQQTDSNWSQVIEKLVSLLKNT